ncbi:MAG: endolytic transglycosylase MltG, partial [Gammaproteobacteria bacterium]|nr:endolytic transglycosylase MltG [Gammaproteobacteria bacterium]
LGRETDAARRLQTGEYKLMPDMTPASLLEALTSGDVIQHALVIVEGQTFHEVLETMRRSDVLQQTLGESDASDLMVRLGHAGEHPEGRFLPDTYHFPGGTTDVAFLGRAYNAMAEELAAAWDKRDEGLPFSTPYEALILASIVEKETGQADERPLIAGVFVQRLRKGMRLQTDPTVIYGMGEEYDGNIRRRDLLADTPYNTYTRNGLPPTPIAMPGRHAIDAVMHPQEDGNLYFVARGDGSHYFSRTLKVHEQAVKKFQLGHSHIKLPDNVQPQ